MMEHGLNVKIWGVRGSLAAPFSDRMKFGGNTSCVSAEWEEGMVVFDAGSGIRALGSELFSHLPGERKELHIFISHLHLDHICGLPFLPQLYQSDWTIHLYGEAHGGKTFQESLNQVAGPPYWPVALDAAASDLQWHEILPGETVELSSGVNVHTMRSSHPDETMIFRIEKDTFRVVYGLDFELTEKSCAQYQEFVRNSDLLIFDGMYTDSEYDRYRGFGHSTWEEGIRIMETCGVKTLCIFHHDWSRTDEILENLEEQAKAQNDRCLFAREGMAFHFKEE